MSNTPETSVVFRRVGGHSHNGLTSSLIDTTKYSLFDFSPVLNGTSNTPRRQFQDNNRQVIKKFIVDTIEERVLNPQGIEIQANVITARNIVSNTITADELSANLVLVNNIIRSNTFNGTFYANGTIATSGTTGWAISNGGSAVFNDATIRGQIVSNNGTIGGWVIDSTLLRTANTVNGLKMESFGNISAFNNSNINDRYIVSLSSGGINSIRIRNNTYSQFEILQTQNRQADYFVNTPPLNDNLEQTIIYTSQYISLAKRTNIGHLLSETARMIQFNNGNNVYGLVEAFSKDTSNNTLQRVTMDGNAGTLYASSGITTGGTLNGYSFTSGRHDGANQIVHTDGYGYLQVGYINSAQGYNENNAYSPDRVWGSNGGSDSYLRTYRTSSLSVGYAADAGSYSGSSISTGSGTFTVWYGANSPLRAARPYVNGEGLLAFFDTDVNRAAAGGIRWGTSASDLVVWDVASDVRLKNNIRNFDDGLDLFRLVRPVKFNWNSNDAESHGFIAQELMEIYPPAVLEPNADSEYYGVSTLKMVPLMAAAMKGLIDKIDELESRLKTLEGV